MVWEESSMGTLGPPERNQSVLEQIKPETSLEGKTTKLKLSYFRHLRRRQGSLEQSVVLGKMECRRKRRRPN